jgi:hypothetical protein
MQVCPVAVALRQAGYNVCRSSFENMIEIFDCDKVPLRPSQSWLERGKHDLWIQRVVFISVYVLPIVLYLDRKNQAKLRQTRTSKKHA